MKSKIKKLRTTISMEIPIHAIGVKLAASEKRDFSAMLANAIVERWENRKRGTK